MASGGSAGLVAATDSVDRARKTLVPLFSGNCRQQRDRVIWMEHELDREVAALIAVYPCVKEGGGCSEIDRAACLADLEDQRTDRAR